MELIKHTAEWVNGEVTQGKIMVAIGILMVIAGIAIFRSEHEILRGALIPVALAVLLTLGYGSFMVVGRPAHQAKITKVYEENPEKAVGMEYEKAMRDHKTYSMLRFIWPSLIIISAIFYAFAGREYFQGLAIGLIFLFLTGLILDGTLHHRLGFYLEAIREMTPS